MLEKKRFAGESKYPLKKMIKFAFDGITSFSTVPIRLITNLGLFIAVVGIVLFIQLYVKLRVMLKSAGLH